MAKRIEQNVFATLLNKEYNSTVLSAQEIRAVGAKYDVMVPKAAWANNVSRGLYDVPGEIDESLLNDFIHVVNMPEVAFEPVAAIVKEAIAPKQMAVSDSYANFVPQIDTNFVKWGNYKEIEIVIKSSMFFPVYVTGESGNGKTTSIVQACANMKREVIRVNFTSETCEEDLLGSYTLQDGNTVWQDGPAVAAMKKGAVLLLDEFDLANPNRITCLNAVLEGNNLFIKRTGELVESQPGFTVIATANTKGKGGSGRYIGANSQNEAVLDRFSITIEQEYAGKSVEKKIITNILRTLVTPLPKDLEFVTKLVDFGDIIRSTYNDGGVEELLSTRRLIDMVKSYIVFGRDRRKAIQYGINRFDEDTVDAFNSLYENLDETMRQEEEVVGQADNFV